MMEIDKIHLPPRVSQNHVAQFRYILAPFYITFQRQKYHCKIKKTNVFFPSVVMCLLKSQVII